MLKITRFCGVCRTKRVMIYDGNVSVKHKYYFTCEKGHHCEVFVSKNLWEAINSKPPTVS